jgi:hypothetical protein
MDSPPDTEYKGHATAVYSRVDASSALNLDALNHETRSFSKERSAAWGKVDLTREYSAKHQFLHIFWKLMLGFIFNSILWGGYAFVTWYVSTLGPLNKDKERLWNVVSVGLPLFIGLHTSVGARRSLGTCLSETNNLLVGLQKFRRPNTVAGASE